MRCPRSDPQNLKVNDIFEVECPQCGAFVEMWKGDHSSKCHKCNTTVYNPQIEEGEESQPED